MTVTTLLLAAALNWIVRLPLCGDRELGRLLLIHEHDARRLAWELISRRWVESVEPGSPELDTRRRYFVGAGAAKAIASALDAGGTRQFPLSRRAILRRVGCFELTVGLNGFFAALAHEVFEGGEGVLADARSLPLTVAGERWWPHSADGYGCLQGGAQWAPFFVVWDRAAAPDLRRRKRLANWVKHRAAVARAWGAEGPPPLFIVCPGEREVAVWERECRRLADAGKRLPTIFLASRRDLDAEGVTAAVWRCPGDVRAWSLTGAVGWGMEPAINARPLPGGLVERRLAPSRAETLRDWAERHASAGLPGAAWTYAPALALTAGPIGISLLRLIARHPLLTARGLAGLVRESVALVQRRLACLLQSDAVGARRPEGSPGGRADSGMNDENEARYTLTEKGRRFLADSAGTGYRMFDRRAGITSFDASKGETADSNVRHVEHTIGLNEFVSRLAADSVLHGVWLREVQNERAAAFCFVTPSGRESWIRPDAACQIEPAGTPLPLLIEYERGTLDARNLRSKLRGYVRYFSGDAWKAQFDQEPVLLFVCADDSAERRVARVLDEISLKETVLTTTDWRVRTEGTFGAIWREQSGERRVLIRSTATRIPTGEAVASMSEKGG